MCQKHGSNWLTEFEGMLPLRCVVIDGTSFDCFRLLLFTPSTSESIIVPLKEQQFSEEMVLKWSRYDYCCRWQAQEVDVMPVYGKVRSDIISSVSQYKISTVQTRYGILVNGTMPHVVVAYRGANVMENQIETWLPAMITEYSGHFSVLCTGYAIEI